MTNPPTVNLGHTSRDYLEAYERLGNYSAVAREFGVHESTARKSIQRALSTDPAVMRGMNRLGMKVVPGVAWIKTKATADAPGYSFMVRTKEDVESTIDRIWSAFENLTPAAPVEAPSHVLEELMTVYLIADAHVGLLAWGKETGEDYDTATACARIRGWVGKCIAASPPSGTAIILAVGDTTHANDQTNLTPKSKHGLDVDTRHFKTLDMTIEAMCAATDLALHKHEKVVVRILPGNHDPEAYLSIMFAMYQRYRNEPRVEVQKIPGEHFVFTFGRVLIAAHHGHRAKAKDLVLYLAAQWARLWGETEYRYLFTGHMHHHKSEEIGGVFWEQLSAMAAKDGHMAASAYVSRAAMQAIVFDQTRGEIMRVKVSD